MAIPIIDGFDLSKSGPIDQRFVAADQTARLAFTWLYKGMLCYQIDNNSFYKYIGVPNSNLVGDWQLTLTAGPAGAAGTIIYNGSGVPSGGIGVINDYYLNTVNGDFYQKTGVSTWGLLINLKGPTGASGVGSGDYASKYVTAGATPQSLTTTDAVITQFPTAGPNVGAVPGTNLITLNSPGAYQLHLTSDITGIAAAAYQFTMYINAVAQPSSVITVTLTGADTTSTVAMNTVVNVASAPVNIELRGKTLAGTNNLTFTNGSWGITGINLTGATGAAGKALVHTEADITLNDAKVASVQAGSWTTINPWSASVVSDSRSSYTVPAAITGNKTGHSISYNGTTWIDNGTWRGPTGTAGAPGADGSTFFGDLKPVVAPTGAPSLSLALQATNVSTKNYPSFTYTSGPYTVPCIQFQFAAYRSGADLYITAYVEASTDNASWFTVKQIEYYTQRDVSFNYIISCVHNIAPNTTMYYRLTLTGTTTFRPSTSVDYFVFGIMRYL